MNKSVVTKRSSKTEINKTYSLFVSSTKLLQCAIARMSKHVGSMPGNILPEEICYSQKSNPVCPGSAFGVVIVEVSLFCYYILSSSLAM